MADIELIVKIPEELVSELDDDNYERVISWYNTTLYVAIKNGLQLPKGHGRLIDADAFIAMMEDVTERQRYKELLIDDCLTVDDVIEAIIESLQNEGIAEGDSPTIIEADKAESEDKDKK